MGVLSSLTGEYTYKNRGSFQYRNRAKQLTVFENMKYENNITPTDIDGFIEARKRNAMVFYEFKYLETEMPKGQKMAIEELIDTLENGGKIAVAFLCSHSVHNTDEDVDAAQAIVKEIYMHHKWYKGRNKTCKEETDSFFEWAERFGHDRK